MMCCTVFQFCLTSPHRVKKASAAVPPSTAVSSLINPEHCFYAKEVHDERCDFVLITQSTFMQIFLLALVRAGLS